VAKNSYPVRVSDDGEAAVWDPDMNMWCSTTGARLSATQVEGWAPYIKFEEPGAAMFADALNEWVAHWPPRVGNDVELESIYAPLSELTPEQLEQVATAASSLSLRCWEVRGPKLEESRASQDIVSAYVNVFAGRLLPSSVVTVGEASAPVPLSTDTGGAIASHRLSAALHTLGYKTVSWRDIVLDGDTLSFPVRKVTADE
jgi:hypothetical protein